MNNNEYLTKNKQFSDVLKELAENPKLTEERMIKYIDSFDKIYSNDFRHDYSTVTRILFNIETEEDLRDYMVSNIKDIYDRSKELDKKDKLKKESSRTKSLKKLVDHINLENIRLKELIRISRETSMANEAVAATISELANNKMQIYDINEEISKAHSEMQIISNNMKQSTTESITILSIFAGVVMAFTGGMSYISQALASLEKIGPYRSGVFILLIGMIMFNVIFLLLYMIGKLTKRYIGSKGKCKSFENACNNKNIWCSINRYPYFAWFNIILLMIIVTILNLYCIDRYDYLAKIYIYVFNDFKFEKLYNYLFFLIFLFPYIPFAIIIYKMKNSKCNCQ